MMRDRIVKGGAALLMRQMVSFPVNAIGVAFASRFLLPKDYGIQAILTPIIALSLMLIDLGTSQALIQGKSYPAPKILRQVQFLKSGLGIIVIGLLTALSAWLVRILGLSHDLILIFPTCGLIGWLQSQRAYQAVALQRRVEWQRLAKVEMAEIVIFNCALIMAAYYTRTAWCFVIALAFRMGLGALILKVVNRSLAEKNAGGGTSLGALLRFGVPLQSTTLLSVLMNSANPIVVGGTLGIKAVGFLNWSNYVVALPQLPLQPLPSFLFSVLSERGRQDKDDHKTIEDLSYIGAFLMAVFALGIIMILELLVRHIFGLQWLEAIPAASVLVLSNIVMVPSQVITAQLNARGHSATSLAILGYGVILWWFMIVLAALLKGGLVGYALGVLVSTMIAFLVQCSLASKRLDTRVDWSASIRFVAYVAACVGAAELISQGFNMAPSVWGEATKSFLALMIFAVFMYSFERTRLKQVYASARRLFS